MAAPVPPALLRSLSAIPGFDSESFIGVHESAEQITSIRLNPWKLISSYDGQDAVPWCNWGRYLDKRPSFTADPLFHAGCYYVQEASSMFLEQVLSHTELPGKQLRVLDLCASPGGKSTHLSSLLSGGSLLVSNEIIKSRVLTLADNLTKWGPINTVVTNNDPEAFGRVPGYFDVVVVDAPCSGSGMFRKDPAAIHEWSEHAVSLCSQRQKRILADVYPALKEDGILIYSTCSYSAEENEDIADWLCDTFEMESIQVPFDPSTGVIETRSTRSDCAGYRFYPHQVRGEGFFITCLRKRQHAGSVNFSRRKQDKPAKDHINTLHHWLAPQEPLHIFPVGEEYAAILREHEDDLAILQSKLYLKKSGVRLGRIAGKDLIPDHELALSLIMAPGLHAVNMTYEQAIAYLRRDDVRLATEARGWTLMQYENFALGWAKVLPNRINNYYPKELRILKEI